MTHSLSPVLRVGRWLRPWVVLVFASASIAYAISGALAGDASARDPRRDVQVAVSTSDTTGPAAVEPSTTSPSAQPADLGPLVTPKRCPPIDGSYVDTVILTDTRKIDCGWAS